MHQATVLVAAGLSILSVTGCQSVGQMLADLQPSPTLNAQPRELTMPATAARQSTPPPTLNAPPKNTNNEYTNNYDQALPYPEPPLPEPEDVATQPTTNAPVINRPSPTGSSQAALISLYGDVAPQRNATQQPAFMEDDGDRNLRRVTFAELGGCFNPDISRDGSLVVFASTMHRATSDIYVKSTRGQTHTQLTTDPGNDIMPTFDPSGRIAFASDRSGNWDIYIMPGGGGQATQLTRDPDHELHPSFSPDGTRMAYCKLGTRSGRWEIWMIDLDRPGTPQFVTYGLFPQWSPDVRASKLLFQRPRQRGSRMHSIWTIDYINGDGRNLTEIVSASNAAVINPAWSPDGTQIVFVTDVSPQDGTPVQSDVWVVNLDGSGRTALTNGRFANYEPVWAGDGTIYFISNRTGIDNIWATTTRMADVGRGSSPANMVTVDPDDEYSSGQP
jgi:TolB protein